MVLEASARSRIRLLRWSYIPIDSIRLFYRYFAGTPIGIDLASGEPGRLLGGEEFKRVQNGREHRVIPEGRGQFDESLVVELFGC